jgi:transcriptional regulator with XRE-family HTH domain
MCYNPGMAEMGPTTRRNAERLAGNLLRLARIERGWTQAQLAAAAGITQPVIARIESGKVQPTLPTLCRLLAAADLDLRCRLKPYDDHDDVLDARAAQFPEEQRRAEQARDALLAAAHDAAE